ncbi:MAG: penicillin-binding protein 2 [Bacteroidales bacterium]|nr:penicillin-binding protein 2 [Bacteroidales bacterium]
MTQMQGQNGRQSENRKKADGKAIILFLSYWVMLGLSIFLIISIVKIQFSYRTNPDLERRILPVPQQDKIAAVRGDILAEDGRVLATSTPLYDIHMDCTVCKKQFAGKPDEEKKWRESALELSEGYSRILGIHSANEWYNMIIKGRDNNNGWLQIAKGIDHKTLLDLKKLPLFRNRKNYGGCIVTEVEHRLYPFGSLARRTIGYVKNNSDTEGARQIGIEGSFNDLLKGEDGYEWIRSTDGGKIRDCDSTWAEAKDGFDIRTTIDIDIQDVADNALRKVLGSNRTIDGACAVVMEVKTGAIKAMVNLKGNSADTTGSSWNETYNYAIQRGEVTGSIFKAATLMAALEEGSIHLSDSVKTYGGIWPHAGKVEKDEYVPPHKYPSGYISIAEAFAISSNIIFRCLAYDTFNDRPGDYLKYLDRFHLTEPFEFEISGMTGPYIPRPDEKGRYWSATDLASLAIGYSIKETPLQMLAFYNSIANGGKMMKPYIIQSIEKDGRVKERFKPQVLEDKVCSRATADTLKKALRGVVTYQNAAGEYKGTGKSLRNSLTEIAGKTGTGRIFFKDANGKMSGNDGKIHQHIGSFVGFFPYENPQYSVIAVVYSKPSGQNFYGGTYGGPVVREIADRMCALGMVDPK